MDNINNNQINQPDTGRLIWLDPNKANNVMVNPEDLTINVEFKSFRKGRSLIFSGEEINNTQGSSTGISFIEGSKNNKNSENRSLTTRYTNAISLDLMNPSDNQLDNTIDDYESLGIESIDIEFNTAYTPIIKIKFIDVRGNAILSQGNSSKYKMFFELPYPLFSLKIKGFYGKAVTYCLHLQRWNANFNSETGNFEIQADFIGYTYAFLTDMIIGLVRATSFTETGKKKLSEKRAQHKLPESIITIDEMLKKIQEFNFSLNKINDSEDSAVDLQTYNDIYEIIDKIKSNIVDFIETNGGETPPFKDSENGLLVLNSKNEDVREKFKDVKEIILSNIKLLNEKISENSQNLKFSEKINSYILLTKGISKLKLEEEASRENTTFALKTSGSRFTPPWLNSVIDDVNNITDLIKLDSGLPNDTELDVYNFKLLLDEIEIKEGEFKTEENNSVSNLIDNISDISDTTLGFEPNIRNIFRVLTVNTEVFLEVLRDVSVSSQNNNKRIPEIGKLFNNQINFNVNLTNKDKEIYAWPEYREKKDGDYVETYMGSNKSITPENIDELVFTEELLKGFIDVVKSEDDLLRQELAAESGLDIDKLNDTIEYKWWPVSTADTPIGNNFINKNPYLVALEENPANGEYEIIRVLIYRAFLLVGVSYYNNKIPRTILKSHARLEVENVLSALRGLNSKEGKNGKDIASLLNNKDVESIINVGKDGHDKLKINGEKKPFFVSETKQLVSGGMGVTQYSYNYITNDKQGQVYIPVNRGFSGANFFSNGKIKNSSQLKTLANDGHLFVSNPINLFNGFYQRNDDGSYLFDIIDYATYVSNDFKPEFGYNIVEEQFKKNNYTTGLINVETAYTSIVEKPTLSGYFENDGENITISQPFPWSNDENNPYSVHDFNLLNYIPKFSDKFSNFTGEQHFFLGDNKIASSLLSFYSQYDGGEDNEILQSVPSCGTYLSLIPEDGDIILNTGVGTKVKIYKDGDKGEKINLFNFIDTIIPPYMTSPSFPYLSSRKTLVEDFNYTNTKKILHGVTTEAIDESNIYLPYIEFGSKFDPIFKFFRGTKNTDRLPETTVGFSGTYNGNLANLSLFGSWFYNQQKYREVKALLFLHTIPWQGVKNFSDDANEFMMFDKRYDWVASSEGENDDKKTRILSIRSMFQWASGLIHAPKSWVLFIGGILWRIKFSNENSTLVNLNTDPILFKDIYNSNEWNTLIRTTNLPSVNDYLFYAHEEGQDGTNARVPWGMFFVGDEQGSNTIINSDNLYLPVDRTIRGLPKQIKDKFINYFIDWVNDEVNGFTKIQSELEIWDGYDKENISDITTHAKKYEDKVKGFFVKQASGDGFINVSEFDTFSSGLIDENVSKNYDFLSVSIENIGKNKGEIGQVNLILKPNTEVQTILVNLFKEPVILKNVNPKTWNYASSKQSQLGFSDTNRFMAFRAQGYNTTSVRNQILSGAKILVQQKQYEDFITEFKNYFDEVNKDFQIEKPVENAEEKQRIFGTTDDDAIKLQIYRTLSSINDKWINGNPTGCPMTLCGNTNKSDVELSNEYKSSDGCLSIIDTFRFVDRAFRDIGDKFYLNLGYISKIITGNYNKSFFDIVNEILSDNNFNFIALPTFFNFNNINDLKTAFTPYSYVDIANIDGNGGPSFVCVYVGQTSKNLDLGVDSVYPDDGLSFNIDSETGSPIIPEGAEDFVGENKPGESNVPVIAVNYGQQNQNYFKSLKLDQREFAETMESLQVIEQISLGGDKSKSSYAGNNLFNVYKTRSYSAEVEMMGSAMIQPMMYFQLNNVPMFRGAYLIFKVTHSIKPHSMITRFKGNRVKKPKTPLLDKATVYMNLIGTTGGSRVSSKRSNKSSYVNKYFSDLIANIPENIIISGSTMPNKNEITKRAEEEISKWNNGQLDEKDAVDLLSVYATTTPGPSASQYSRNEQPWSAVFISYIMIGGDSQFPKSTAHYTYVTAAINGNKGYELFPLKSGLKIKAEIGDLLCQSRTGGYTASHCDVIYKVENNKALIVGGNLGDTVKTSEINLSGGFFIDESDVGSYRLYVKKTDNKYYDGKKIIGTGDYFEAGVKAPNVKCGKASPNDVDTVYPRSVKWKNGPAQVIVKQTNEPTVSVKKSDYPKVDKVETLVTPQEYISAAEKVINKLAPNATTEQKKLILVSAFTISRTEQGKGDGFRGFNNNISGVESDGFKVFNKNDVNGYVIIPEGGTSKIKKYYSFSDLSAGLVPLISTIMARNMFDTGGGANEWAWRWFRDWNGYGARTKDNYTTNPDFTDCDIISKEEKLYNTSLAKVNTLTTYK